jgi:hypothetical protein
MRAARLEQRKRGRGSGGGWGGLFNAWPGGRFGKLVLPQGCFRNRGCETVAGEKWMGERRRESFLGWVLGGCQ